MANILKESKQNSIADLGTWAHTVVTAGAYEIVVNSNMIAPSNLVITIKQNASTLATSATVQAGQTRLRASAYCRAVATDVISVVLTSSSAQDAIPDNIQSAINLIRIG